MHMDVEISAACELLSIGRETQGPHSATDLDGICDLAPFHSVNSHRLGTNRNQSIIRRDGNPGPVPWVSPLVDTFTRINIPHFDVPIPFTADDLCAILGHSNISDL